MIYFGKLGRYGRFGNMLFQIASTIGIARANGQSFAFPQFINHDHKERFGSDEDIDLQKYFENELPKITEAEAKGFKEMFIHWGYHQPNLKKGDWNIEGHLQSQKYFAHAMDEVKHYLRMKDEPAPLEWCAIHWRAGDYIEGAESYHPRQIKNYYNAAMKHFSAEQKFLLFSDDPVAFANMWGANFPRNIEIYSDGKNYIDDFKTMKRCKHFICANSSFSLMAAILGVQPEKKIVVPSLWFGKAAGGLSTADIYPPWSIII